MPTVRETLLQKYGGSATGAQGTQPTVRDTLLEKYSPENVKLRREQESVTARVKSFVDSVDKYYRNYEKDQGVQLHSRGFDAASFFKQRKAESDALKQGASELAELYDTNRDWYTDESYNNMMEYLSGVNTNIDDTIGFYNQMEAQHNSANAGMRAYEDEYKAYLEDQAGKKQAMYDTAAVVDSPAAYALLRFAGDMVSPVQRGITDQWTDEQRYILGTLQNEDPAEARKYARNVNKGQDPDQIAAANEQEEQELLALDLTAAQRELDELNAQYDNYQYDASTFHGRMAAEADLKRMEQEISQKQQIINKARHLQEGVQMASVTGNSDFGEKVGYVSTEYSPNVRFGDYRLDYKDPVYEYINNTPGVRDQVSATNKALANKGYDLMTEEEVANYNYHYATGGKEQAQRYLDTIAESLSERKASQIFQNLKGNTLRELAFSAGVGLNQASENLQNLFSGDDYIAPSAYQIAGGMVREDLADVGPQMPEFLGGSSLGQVGYDLINTAANMAPSMAIGAINPIAGTLTMGASAAGGAYQEALNEGYSKQQARTYSALVGASEAGLEYLLGGISTLGGVVPGGIVEKMLDGVDNAFKRFAIEMGGSVIGEGFEEGLQEVLTPYFQNLALNTDEDVNWNEVAYSALLGALSGGVMEAPGTAANAVSYSLRNRPGTGSSSSGSAPSTPALTENDIKAKVTEDGKSRIISTNESVDANDFASIKNGDASILLSNGNTAPMDDVNFASTEEAARFMTIKSLPGIETEAANDLYHAMKDNNAGSDTDTIVGVRDAYALGYYGFQKSDAAKYGTDAAKLSPALRTAAFEAGQKQRSMNAAVAPKVSTPSTAVKPAAGYKRVVFEGKPKLDKKTRAEVHFMDFVAEKFSGTTVHVYQSFKGKGGKYYYRDTHGKIVEAPNGRYVNDEIWIDLNSGDKGEGLALNTFAHEMYHHVEKWNQKGAQKLAEFVVKELGMADVKSAVNDQIKKAEAAGYGVEHFMKYGNNGKGMTREQAINTVEQRAMSDFVADSLETMFSRGDAAEVITRLKEEDRGLFDKIKEFVDQWVSTLKQWYSDKTISQEGKKVAQLERFEELQKLFLEAVEGAGANYNAALEAVVKENAEAVDADEIHTDGAFVTDGEGTMYSIRSMKSDIAEGKMFEDLMTYCNWTQNQVDTLRNQLNDLVEYMTPFRDILDLNETYDRKGRRFSPYKPNSDPLYKISMDFSTLCSKRLLTQYVIENLQLREGRPMSAEEQMAIRDMLNEYRKQEKGLQVACAMCYVEAARLKSPKQMQKWMDDPETYMRNYFADKDPDFAAYIKGKQEDFKESRGYKRDTPKKGMKSKDVTELNKIRPRLRAEYQPSSGEMAIIEKAKKLPNSTYLTAANLANLSESDPTIYAAYTSFVRTATRSKRLETDEPYYYGDSSRDNGNGIVVTDDFIEEVNRENGMRFSSWSDWRIQHMLDYITAVIDNAVRGAAMHGYTKFPEEVRVLGKTGMMFNMSGVAGTQTGLNEDGSLSFSETESIDVNEAIQLREEFPEHAGLQCIGVGDAHIVKLLKSDIIDYVIPYHTSGLNKALRTMANIHGWKDYQQKQHAAIDKDAKLENAVDKEHWHEEPVFSEFFVGYNTGMTGIEAMRASAENYKRMCAERGLKPKFEQFAKEPNYWKLLIDRKMINQKTGDLIQQKPVTPNFDFDTIKAVVDRHVANYDSNMEARALNHIVENWDSIPKRIRDLKKSKKPVKKSVDVLSNETLSATPMNSLRNAPENIHDVRRRIAAGMDDAANTGNLKKWAGEYREKIAQAETIESNLKIKDQQIQELESSKNPKDKQKFYALRREVNKMREDLGNLNKRIQYIESLKAFRDISAGENAAYSKSLLQQMRNQQAENIQQQLIENRIVREELTGKDSDITIMEKEFIRIAKKYEQLEEKAGANAANKSKTISKLRTALKEEAASHDKDSKIWEREYNRLLREYEASGQKIERMERSISRRKETAKQQIERKKVEEKAKALMKMLTYPTKDAHVPMELQQPLQKFLDSIDFTSPRQLGGGAATIKDIAYTRALVELRSAIASQRTAVESSDDDGVFTLDVPPDFLEEIDKHIKTINDATNGLDLTTNRVYEMSSDELKDLSYILKVVNKAVREIDRLHMQGEKARTSTLAKDTLQEMNRRPATKSEKGNWFMWNNYTPYQAFRRYGKAAQKIFAGLTDGQAKLARTIDSTLKFTKDTYTAEEVRNWERTRHTIKLDSGKTVTMTPAQIMSFWCLSHRNQAIPHMQGAGIRISTLERVLDGTKVQKEVVQREHYTLTVEDVNRINDMLTNRQKDVARKLQQYMQRVGGRLINEVSMARWDFMAATETDYFPIQTEDSGRDVKNPDQNKTSLFALLNKSFTKAPMKNAKNALVIGSIFDVFANHMSETAEYNAFALPLIDALKWFNYRERIDIGEGHIKDIGVHKAIKDTLGTEATRYFVDLMTDINSSQKAGRHEDFFGKILGRSKAASVGWNIRVAIQQPSAIFRASMVLKPGSLVRGTIKKGTVAEMQKYSGIALWKSMGYYDLNVARSVEDQIKGDTSFADKFSDMGMWLPGKMDEWTWGWIWESTKNQVRAETKLSGEELLRATAKKFDDVVYQTQVADSVLTRSSFMRSKSQMVKEATSFMAEPTLSLNVLMSAFQDYEEGHTSWVKAKRGMMIGFTGYVLSGLANALLSSIVDAGRDDDEWETFLEKYGQALLGEKFWDGNLLNEMNPLNKIIFVKDILSAITGYENQSSYGKAISGLIDLVNAVRDGMTGKTSKTTYGIIYQGLQYLSTVSGIGLSNMTREVVGVWNNTFGKLYPDMRLVRYKPNNGEDLLLAIQKGNEADVERVAGRFDDQKSAESALKTAIGSHYKEGSMTEAEATELLTTYGDMDEDEIYWKLQEWNHGKAKGNTENYSKFGALHQAIESGEGIEAEIDRYREHGTEESTIRSDISRVYKKEYLAAAEEDREAIRKKVTPAYVHTGMRDDEIEDKFNDWDFEAKYGMSYSEYKAGYLDDSVSRFELEDAMKFYGLKNYQISETFRSMDKDKKFRGRFGMSLTQMKDAYDDGDVSRNQLINALVYNGMTQKEASQEVTQRDIRNRLGIDYSELDDAYKHGDITRQTLYNAMIENGATRQEADESIQSYDWLKKHVKQYPDLTVSDGKKFSVSLGDNAEGYTLEDFGVSIDSYIEYKQKLPECQGVDANGDGKTDSGTKRDSVFRMIDSLPISDEAKDGLALMSYSKNSIKKNAPWH